ncbi:T6SS immunity protein Tli3 family protein [Klebsiella aerogenes]
MKGLFTALAAMLMAVGCQAQQPPMQVIYRFDDHRYLELKGWDCEGELWYTDTLRGIHTEPVSQFYRIFTKKFIHPSDRYIAIPNWEIDGFIVSKDNGQTWSPVGYSPGYNEPDGMNSPPRDDVLSFTVVNDQGFLQTRHRLYMSSKPFDDPRLAAGGPGIQYVVEGETHTITPQSPGPSWGMVYMTKQGLENDTAKFHANYQGLPDNVPEVKGYTGWDRMRCDMDAGR